MNQPFVIVGGGGMGRCALDLVDAINQERLRSSQPRLDVVGMLDDGSPDVGLWRARGIEFLGRVDQLEQMPVHVGYVLAVAEPEIKRRLDTRLMQEGRDSPVLVHPNVHRGFDVELGPGSLVCSHVSMENHIRVGRHVHVNQNSTIGHDSVIGDYATVSPLVAVSGAVHVGTAAFLGTGASLNQGLTVGDSAVVGAGAAVIGHVESGTTVIGVPARPKA